LCGGFFLREAVLLSNKVVVDDSTLKGRLVEKGFGENKGRSLILDLYETIFLILKEKIVVVSNNGIKVSAKELLSIGMTKEKKFYQKLIVYSDLKERGYCVKTGLKFGFDFRVYPKGKKMGEEHSKFVINVVDEYEKISMTQISASTRLAGNVHTTVVLAVIDSENFVSYYSMNRQLF
jgi:tRNA-intron endonuclease, archaea type